MAAVTVGAPKALSCYWCGPRLEEPCRHQKPGRVPAAAAQPRMPVNSASGGPLTLGRLTLDPADGVYQLPPDRRGGLALGLVASGCYLNPSDLVAFDPITKRIRSYEP